MEKFFTVACSVPFLHNHVVQVWHVGVQEELDELKIKKWKLRGKCAKNRWNNRSNRLFCG